MSERHPLGLILTLCVAWLLPTTADGQVLRDTVCMNQGWLFSHEAIASCLSDHQDPQSQAALTDWTQRAQTVDLPHDFQIGQPWVTPAHDEQAQRQDAANNTASRLSARGFKEMGCGWYCKTFTPDPSWHDRRVLIDIPGIMLVGDVWVNGALAGKTDYGYLGFEADITDKLAYGRENTIVVRADTRQPENSRWYTGGGLYRGVRLIVTPRQQYFARHPLRITTVDNRQVCITAEVYSNDREATALHFNTRIIDAQGSVVAEQRSEPPCYRRQKQREYILDTITLQQPRLWSPDTPYLYTAEVTLYDRDGRAVDRVSDRFGVRTVAFGPDFGLRVNGQKVLLQGWANHHTLGALGAAAYPRAIEKRLRLMKDYGFNHVRTSHNPYSEDFYRLCDEIGLLVTDELYDKWTRQYAGGREEWTTLWQHDIPEWVKRDRNHPSIVMWSLGNELQQMADLPYNDWGVTAYRLQRELLRRYDDTRPTTVAMHPRYRDLSGDSLPAPLARATDIQAYNYRYMYFPGDGKRFPWMTFYQSEASTTALPANYFAMDRERVVGLAYWGAIDYLGESRGWPMKGWGDGIFDITLQPKPLAALVRSMFKPEEPVVQIAIVDQSADSVTWNGIKLSLDQTSDHWNRTPGQRLKLYTYTNADEVELFVNGHSLGCQRNQRDHATNRNKITWEGVVYEPGTIEAVARTGGRVVARQRSQTTGEAVALRLLPDNNHWRADGEDLQHVRVVAVDSKGRHVGTAEGHVTFAVDGPASIVAVDNGDPCGNDIATQQHVDLYHGTALAILRSSKTGGKVTLSATLNHNGRPLKARCRLTLE